MDKVRKALNEYAIARWGILILVGFILSVNYYFYDAFSTLKDLMSIEFGFDNIQYGLFVAFYSIPNTFLLMAVIGGVILDKVGIRRTGFMFVFFMALGAFITAYGASESYSNGGFGYAFMQTFLPDYSPELKMMLVGRFFYGLGAETSIVVVSKILVKWFRGKDLALAFGLKVGFGRLGTFAALRLSPVIAGGAGLSTAIWLAAVLVGLGLLAMVIYILFDARLNSQIKETEEEVEKDKFSVSDIFKILSSRTFIYIALLCVTFYSAVFPFMAFAPVLFKPINENHSPNPVTHYGKSKLKAEQYVMTQKKLPWIIVRPTIIYGPREKNFFNMVNSVNHGLEMYVGSKKQKLSFIFVKDLADIFVKLSVGSVSQKVYNVCDGEAYSAVSVNQIIRSALNKKTICIVLPVRLVRVIAFYNEIIGRLKSVPPILNRDKVNEMEQLNWLCDNSKIQKELGYSHTVKLKEGMIVTINWYKKNGWL